MGGYRTGHSMAMATCTRVFRPVGGKVYRFAPDGSHQSVVFDTATKRSCGRLTGMPAATCLSAQEAIRDSSLSVCRNPKMALPGKAVTPPNRCATFVQKHVRAISARGNDIFVGTGGDGVLYRVDGENRH